MYDEEGNELPCPGEGECEDDTCESRRNFEVTYTYTITAHVLAHSEKEANDLARDVSPEGSLTEPNDYSDGWSDWNEEGLEWYVTDTATRAGTGRL
jgi:uncharacterized ferritin-like protein (DUF455 family)